MTDLDAKNKATSRRVTAGKLDVGALDVLAKTAEDAERPPRPVHCRTGEYLFMAAQLITLFCIGLATEYGDGTSKDAKGALSNNGNGVLPTAIQPPAGKYDMNKDFVQNKYAVFQDVHVMIFIGFGFLMTFIKTSSWSALAFNWIISAWALQWAILTTGLFHQIVHGGPLHKIQIDLSHLIMGDFGAGAAMITFGAVLGKCNLQQLFFLVWWEMIWYGLNEAICVGIFNVTDAGGSILVHTFGAYFGVAATYGFQPGRSSTSMNMQSNYASEMVAVLGSVFLWMFWPSFNGALAEGTAQHRIMVNTTLGIVGSVISAASTSRLLFGKLDMEIILNATLAGGVAIGSSCDLICEPWVAITVGMAGGILSSVGFARMGPWFSDSPLALQDTCGVHSLHGMPGVFAACFSMYYLTTLEGKGFPDDYFTTTSKDLAAGGLGLTYQDQALAQLKSLVLTLAVAIGSGYAGGKLCSLDLWNPVHALFRDDDHFHHVLQKYPKEYLEVSDESVAYARESILDIRKILFKIIPANIMSTEGRVQWLVSNIYEDIVRHDNELNKDETLQFINDFIEYNKDHLDEGNEYQTEKMLPGQVFDKVFMILDFNGNNRVSCEEIMEYFAKLIQGRMTHGAYSERGSMKTGNIKIKMKDL